MRRQLSLAAASVLAGCTLVTSLDGLSGGGDPVVADEAGSLEAGAEASMPLSDAGSTVDANVDAGPLLSGGDFEATTTLCNGPSFNSDTDVISSNPHAGKSSCRVCASADSESTFSLDIRPPAGPPIVGATYRASAFVRRPQNESFPPAGVYLNIRSFNDAPFTVVEIATMNTPTQTAWSQVSVDLKITKPAQALDIFASALYGENTCFIIDDLTLTKPT